VRALLRHVARVVRDPNAQRGAAFLALSWGLRHLWEDTFHRLDDLEQARGMVPLDDVVTVADLDKVKRELRLEIAASSPGAPEAP
jgi:hypothetical protein